MMKAFRVCLAFAFGCGALTVGAAPVRAMPTTAGVVGTWELLRFSPKARRLGWVRLNATEVGSP